MDKEIRVAQLAGYISEHGAYHHGEVVRKELLSMAQDYVGSNNINLLEPQWTIWDTLHGGKG